MAPVLLTFWCVCFFFFFMLPLFVCVYMRKTLRTLSNYKSRCVRGLSSVLFYPCFFFFFGTRVTFYNII